ncbi:hypothetical protein PVAND_004906 [Polypedilum vanderplanki]|uniref:SET and MYND domain-containing protein n=1 Tax=Polypedilum vanderplanki TaxID=319348 RepID=A0A9J6BYY7_POLVA|nr:hypothetical protein PVAND_004906 [Polypedilum vanderplanki]
MNFFIVEKGHENLENISNKIEIKRDNYYGRMIVAKENLLCGDIIALEEPIFYSLDKCATQQRCANCLKILTKIILCQECKCINFCSHACQNQALDDYHKFECKYFRDIDADDGYFLFMSRMLFKSMRICGSVEKLMHNIENIDESLTVFNKIKDQNDELFYLLCCYNLECANFYDDLKFVNAYLTSSIMKSLLKSKTTNQREMYQKLILKILGILNRNSFHLKFKDDSEVGALFAFTSLFNHSCSPNVEKIKIGKKIGLVCKSPISKNEQLFLCYRKPFYIENIEKRQTSLYKQFNFICQCAACSNEQKYPLMQIESNYEVGNDMSFLIDKYKSNCKFINENYNDYPSSQLVQLIHLNKQILDEIACKINHEF